MALSARKNATRLVRGALSGHLEGTRWLRILRPLDLLHFEVAFSGLTLEAAPVGKDDEGAGPIPVLRAGSGGGLLKVRWPFQHVAEISTKLAADGSPLTAPPDVPVAARAANRSRLVFQVPEGEEIEFSTDGILDAMARLEMAVVPVARPAPSPKAPWLLSTLSDMDKIVAVRLADLSSHKPPPTRGKIASSDLIRAGSVARRYLATGALERRPIDIEIGVIGKRPRRDPVRAPTEEETAIEAPFRLILSPSKLGAWAHAMKPVSAPEDPGRVELWHSRLAVRGDNGPDETNASQRIVRAIWTRDREARTPSDPFRHSLRHDHRARIVRQTSGAPDVPDSILAPVSAKRLDLSALGASLDLKVTWPYKEYTSPPTPLGSWDHIAPMGRDQWVRVVTPLASFPPGHDAYLVEVTYRAIVGTTNPQARLFSYVRVVLGDPYREYGSRDLPFSGIHLGPAVSPNLNDPDVLNGGEVLFVPTPAGNAPNDPFYWTITGFDHDRLPSTLLGALVFYSVPASKPLQAAAEALYRSFIAKDGPISKLDARGQSIAFAPNAVPTGGTEGALASTASETSSLVLDGTAGRLTATPRMVTASIIPQAMRRMSPNPGPIDVKYPQPYLDQGFDAANKALVYLEAVAPKVLDLGSSAQSGGFVRPDVTIGGLSRRTGIVGDVAKAAAGTFDPKSLLPALGEAKLFGLIDLVDLIPDGLLDKAPRFLTETLDQLTSIARDAQALRTIVTEAAVPTAAAIAAEADKLAASLAKFLGNPGDATALGDFSAAAGGLVTKASQLANDLAALPVTPAQRADLSRLSAAIAAHNPADLIKAIETVAKGFDPGNLEARARLEWRTPLDDWKGIFVAKSPAGKKTELVISVETRGGPKAKPRADVAAEMSAFELLLVPGEPLARVKFERLAFRTSTGRKAEVDVKFDGIEFLGILSFVNSLTSLVPLDGFSDPPFVDVSAEGARAGFTIALPNLAIGIFSLTNISLGADAKVPFLGDMVSVGFNFCTRERPFTLAVAFLGGGGFFGIRVGPKGVVLLEAAFEFGAYLALDFGVASGSVSAMAGIYFKIESDKGSLTGYFRVRGQVDVLSLITASIELYMALTYAFDTGKMIGEASITVQVEVLFLSTSVRISTRREFAGSNGDPTVREMLAPEGQPIDRIWNDYCGAFAAEAA